MANHLSYYSVISQSFKLSYYLVTIKLFSCINKLVNCRIMKVTLADYIFIHHSDHSQHSTVKSNSLSLQQVLQFIIVDFESCSRVQ